MFPDVPFSLHPRPRLSICALTPIALHTTAAVATASTLLKASGFQGSPGSYSWSPPPSCASVLAALPRGLQIPP